MSGEEGKSNTPAEALADAVRIVVRDELHKPEPTATDEKPTWRDARWLLILIANVVLIFDRIPEDVRKDFEILDKVLPWVAGGAFVLGTTWYHDRFLALSRKTAFRYVMALALIPLALLHFRIIPIRPVIVPPEAHFLVDDKSQEGHFEGKERVWVTLEHHVFKVQPYDTDSKDPVRTVEWDGFRVLSSVFKSKNPRWALAYKVSVVSDGEKCRVHIKAKEGEELDEDFFDPRLEKQGDSLIFRPQMNSDEILLPKGEYRLVVEEPGCSPTKDTATSATVPSSVDVNLRMKCP
jgi:hypothetical protein